MVLRERIFFVAKRLQFRTTGRIFFAVYGSAASLAAAAVARVGRAGGRSRPPGSNK